MEEDVLGRDDAEAAQALRDPGPYTSQFRHRDLVQRLAHRLFPALAFCLNGRAGGLRGRGNPDPTRYAETTRGKQTKPMIGQKQLTVPTQGRGTYDITREIEQAVRESGVRTGFCHVFVHHTSASLILCENADPVVRRDLEAFFSRMVPDGDRLFHHTAEGADDMPAHVRSILTNIDLTLPVSGGRCALGTWQGIYLYEHRSHGHRRQITVTVSGD